MTGISRSLSSFFRGFLHSPGFSVLCILTLGVGIGANTAIFGVIRGVLLQPLPFPEPEKLVTVWHTSPGNGSEKVPLSDAAYLFYRRANRGLDEIGLYLNDAANLAGTPEPERVTICMTTGSLFSLLGVPPLLGRTFVGEDERPGAEPLAVISHELWRRRFDADPKIIGRTLRIDGIPRRIVGVMPEEFGFPRTETSVWLPLTIDPVNLVPQNFNYRAIGRLRTGVTPEGAAREMSNLVQRLPEEVGEPFTWSNLQRWQLGVLVRDLREEKVGDVARTLWTFLGSTGLILLIACANVANLILVRAEARRQEVAVRVALGASRGEIARLFLTESVLLASGGGVLGLFLALAAVRLLLRLQPQGIPRLEEVGIDITVILFMFVVTLLAGLLSGILAVLRAMPPELVLVLKEGGRSGTAGKATHRIRRALVVVQIALALVLLVGAALVIKSYSRLQSVDPGFQADGVLTVFLTLPRTEYPDAQAVAGFVRDLQEQVRAVPGVRSAAMVSLLPLEGGSSNSSYAIEGHPEAGDAERVSLVNQFVSPGYFETLGIPVLIGTAFERIDPGRRQGEVVISRSVADRFWPGESPLGKRLTPEAAREGEWYTVVGVVENVREAGLHKEPTEVVYFGWRRLANTETNDEHWVSPGGTLVVRTDGDPALLTRSVREAIRVVDPALPVTRFRTMEEVVGRSTARTSFTLLILGIAASVALLLGAVGIYGVISYIVSQRTREIGVRLALGARRRDIAGMVLRDGLALALAGVAAGLVAAFLLTRFIQSLLYQVSPTDSLTFAMISIFLALVALLASWLPAQRAAAVDPSEAIRSG